MIDENTSLRDVAGAVASALRDLDYDPIVVGGSAATVHAPEACRSLDVDMVIVGGVEHVAPLIDKMRTLGFTLRNGMFAHERSEITVEFVPSPVAIGGDVIDEFAAVETRHGVLRVLRAVDVVKDRLNKYVAYEDPDAFEVAVIVARSKSVNVAELREFVDRHAVGVFADRYNEALARLLRRIGLQSRTLSRLGFATTLRVQFRNPLSGDEMQRLASGVQALIDDEREQIDPVLDGVVIQRSPSVNVSQDDMHVVAIPLMVSTKRDLPHVGRFGLANEIMQHLRRRAVAFPEIAEIVETPPVIVTTGF